LKIPSSDLYELVKSLTKGEKRYLKVNTGKGKKDYLKLLDALLSQRVYDESVLKEKYQQEAFVQHLAVSKRYLYDYILRALDQYQAGDFTAEVEKLLRHGRILLVKGHPLQAYKQVQKAKQLAYQFELFEQVLNLLKLEKQLLGQVIIQKKIKIDFESIFEEEKNCLAQIDNTNEYWYLSSRMYQLQMRFQKAASKTEEDMLRALNEDARLSSMELATNLRSKMYFLQFKSIYHFTLGETEKAHQYNVQFLQLLESDENYLKRFPERYLSILNNLLIDSLVLKNREAFDVDLEKLKTIPQNMAFKKIKGIDARVFRQYMSLTINRVLMERNFEKGLELIPRLEAGLQQYGNQIPKQHRISLLYLGANLLFCNKQFSASLDWLELIIQDTKEEVVQEIYQFARVLNLLVHFELKNENLLSSLLVSTRRYLRKRRPLYETEIQLFRFLQRQLNVVNKKEADEIWQSFKASILSLSKDRKEARVFNYIDLVSWLGK